MFLKMKGKEGYKRLRLCRFCSFFFCSSSWCLVLGFTRVTISFFSFFGATFYYLSKIKRRRDVIPFFSVQTYSHPSRIEANEPLKGKKKKSCHIFYSPSLANCFEAQREDDLESGGSEVELRYKKIYEDTINPFAAFSNKVRTLYQMKIINY